MYFICKDAVGQCMSNYGKNDYIKFFKTLLLKIIGNFFFLSMELVDTLHTYIHIETILLKMLCIQQKMHDV